VDDCTIRNRRTQVTFGTDRDHCLNPAYILIEMFGSWSAIVGGMCSTQCRFDEEFTAVTVTV